MTKNNNYVIGVDIGGTNMKSVLMKNEKIIDKYILSTPVDDLENFFIILKALVDPLIEKAKNNKIKIDGIGLSVAGLCNSENGKIIESPNIPLINGINIVSRTEDTFGLKVKLDNDANCFIRAEVKMGVAQKYNNAFGITIGTGIGGGWWLNNNIYTGANNNSGEIKRMVMEDKKELEDIYQKLTQHNPENLAEEAYRGDDLAIKIYNELGYYFGIACANIVNMIDPEVIIIGGGVIESSDLFLSTMKKTAHNFIMHPDAKKIKIKKSKFGKDACAIGARYLISGD